MRAALRLSNGAPAAALALLQPDRWQARQTPCAPALNSALSGDILQLLPALNSDDVAVRLGWLLSLLVDAMKVQQGASNWLSNGDRPDVVTQLAQQFSSSALNAERAAVAELSPSAAQRGGRQSRAAADRPVYFHWEQLLPPPPATVRA